MNASDSVSTLVEGILQAVESFIPPRLPEKYSFDVQVSDNKVLGIFNVPSVKQEIFNGWFAFSLLPDPTSIVSVYIEANHRGHQGHLYTTRNARPVVVGHVLMIRDTLEQLPEELLYRIHEAIEKEPKFDFNS